MQTNSLPQMDETDVLFSTSPRALAARFGDRTRQLIADGRDPAATARLAASYAFLAEPALRDPATTVRHGLEYARQVERINSREVHRVH